ncbi:MAG: DMT family transporter [Hyphomicrobiaceae bacterium]
MHQAQASFSIADRSRSGIIFVLLGVIAFTVQDVIVKFLSGDYSIHQIVLFRCLGALPFVSALFLYEGGIRALRVLPLGRVTLRSVIQYLSYMLWFLSLGAMSIADALAIGFVSPLIITALSALVLGARIGLGRWLAIVAGFAGAIVMLRPGFGVFEPAALLVLASAVCYAVSAILTRRLGATVSSAAMSLHSLMLAMLLSGLAGWFANGIPLEDGSHPSLQLMFRAWKWPEATDAALMLSAGVAAGAGMIAVAQAYRISLPAVIAPFEYTAMIWALLAGYVFWSAVPDVLSIAGTIFIIGAGLYIAICEGVRRPDRRTAKQT